MPAVSPPVVRHRRRRVLTGLGPGKVDHFGDRQFSRLGLGEVRLTDSVSQALGNNRPVTRSIYE